ncbi:hypothetical protein AB0F17_65685 [Nonomuraea sp. NPDC026600]|uniref:hypothetical protein n=1 Tax=Nonomuraea sp. NPDC026600 TaxID=3155363 RepID=UPI0033D4773B
MSEDSPAMRELDAAYEALEQAHAASRELSLDLAYDLVNEAFQRTLTAWDGLSPQERDANTF